MTFMDEPLKFPAPLQHTQPEARRLRLLRWSIADHLRTMFWRLLNAAKVPGAIADTEIDDPATGNHVSVRRGLSFTVISVNGRDYYFRRLSGRFDGTGMGCDCCAVNPPQAPLVKVEPARDDPTDMSPTCPVHGKQ